MSVFAVGVLAACQGQSGHMQRGQQQYQVVEEAQANGSATAVDSDAQVRPPVTTVTNADTTTAFTLGTVPAPANMPGGPGGSIAGTLPPAQPGTMAPMPQAATTTTTQVVRAPVRQPAPLITATTQPSMISSTTMAPTPAPKPGVRKRTPPPETTEEAPQPTDATVTEKPKDKPKTDTTDTTDTTKTDTQPPPTQTDTVGHM